MFSVAFCINHSFSYIHIIGTATAQSMQASHLASASHYEACSSVVLQWIRVGRSAFGQPKYERISVAEPTTLWIPPSGSFRRALRCQALNASSGGNQICVNCRPIFHTQSSSQGTSLRWRCVSYASYCGVAFSFALYDNVQWDYIGGKQHYSYNFPERALRIVRHRFCYGHCATGLFCWPHPISPSDNAFPVP